MVLLRTWTIGVLTLPIACGAAPQTAARAPATARPEAPGRTPPESPNSGTTAAADTPVRNFADAEALAQNELGAEGRDARFAADRQIAELERAVLLYKQFIQKAGDDPAYAEAVKRAKDRIDDINDTLIFIRKNPND